MPSNDEELSLQDAIEWLTRRRPDWEQRHPGAVREALLAAVSQGLGTLREAASALRELAEDHHGETGSPRRLLHAGGRWWQNARSRPSGGDRQVSGPRCDQRGHEHQPANECALCASEVLACMDCPRDAARCPHTHLDDNSHIDERSGRWLPGHLRQRVQGREDARA